jgi:hypothetical protein
MFGSEDSIEKQNIVKYKLLREKWKDRLVGIEDERVRRVHFLLQRLLDNNELSGKGKRWGVRIDSVYVS